MGVDRRTVLQAGGALLLSQNNLISPTPRLVQGFVFDQRFPEGDVQARLAARQGMWVRAFEGDVTELWLNHLRPHWATGLGSVAGLTNASALFCLEQMARGERYRVIQKEPQGTGPHAAIAWLIDRSRAV